MNSPHGLTFVSVMLRHCSRLLLRLAVSLPLVANAEPPSSAFGPGEHTVYEIRYLGIAAGIADLRVGSTLKRDGVDVWPIISVGQTTSFASLYQVNDRFISYWDPNRAQNVGSDFFVEENRKRRRERYSYDRQARTVFATKQKEGNDPVDREFEIRADALDLAAAGFWLRNMPLSVGAQYERAIFTGSKQFVMHADVEARESVDHALGHVRHVPRQRQCRIQRRSRNEGQNSHLLHD